MKSHSEQNPNNNEPKTEPETNEGHSSEFELSRREFMTTAVAAGVVASLPTLPVFAKTSGRSTVPSGAPARAASFQPFEMNLKVNGKSHAVKVDTRTTLLDLLREELQLTGAKKGCDHGQCGACTVLVDGKRINSCLSLAVQNQGKDITTIEGLAHGNELHPMQTAFIEHDAFQCGYCTPGQIMSAVALLKEPCGTSEAEVRECMSGNICRCGAYRNILSAISDARGKARA